MSLIDKKHGPVFTVWFGPVPTVHITDLEIAQNAMIKQGANFVDRWVPLLFTLPRNGFGLITSSGKVWQDHRRFSQHTLRNFGIGRNIIEEKIMEEFNLKFDEVDRQIQKSGCHIVDPQPLVEVLVGSVINRVLFSESFDNSNDYFFVLKENLNKSLSRLTFLDTFVYKFMLSFPFIRGRYEEILKPFYQLKDYFRNQFQQRQVPILHAPITNLLCAGFSKARVESGKHVLEGEGRDYVDAYMIKMMEEMKGNQEETTFTEEALLTNLLDLWIAGQETTTMTVLSGIINLLNYPEAMDKAREEIKRVTGNNRPLSLLDRPTTTYFNATITEIQRLASVVNFNLWRRSSENSNVGGFTIPGGTTIAAQLSVLLSDSDHFKKHNEFDPSRYLKEERLDQHVVPFGIGKRSCLGESLARAELYLIIGNLLQRYQISAVDELPSREPMTPNGVVRKPKPFLFSLFKIM
ncbi:unspecific monooxygenase [Oesophagostomum dentatum]|uniref:Unspecific monooxygenase n=1 Tax=Oesophagostomum dentatum TaxID=61180 RepID=A0A0B1TL17_OESDE|nr:unspecific monooxygenase [Oesophagostomum dentatum]